MVFPREDHKTSTGQTTSSPHAYTCHLYNTPQAIHLTYGKQHKNPWPEAAVTEQQHLSYQTYMASIHVWYKRVDDTCTCKKTCRMTTLDNGWIEESIISKSGWKRVNAYSSHLRVAP